MKTVKDKTFHGVEVVMDNTHFIDCKFTNCTLVYSGGTGGWSHTDISDCLITLRGAAASTCGFLEKFDLINPKGRWDIVKVEYPPEDSVQ
jgi:hypothetical protein